MKELPGTCVPSPNSDIIGRVRLAVSERTPEQQKTSRGLYDLNISACRPQRRQSISKPTSPIPSSSTDDVSNTRRRQRRHLPAPTDGGVRRHAERGSERLRTHRWRPAPTPQVEWKPFENGERRWLLAKTRRGRRLQLDAAPREMGVDTAPVKATRADQRSTPRTGAKARAAATPLRSAWRLAVETALSGPPSRRRAIYRIEQITRTRRRDRRPSADEQLSQDAVGADAEQLQLSLQTPVATMGFF